MKSNNETAAVIAVKPETADIKTIVLRLAPGSALCGWSPGQFVTVSLREGVGWTKSQPFTVSNAPGSHMLRITVKRAGSITGMIHALHPGEEVRLAGPFGTFCGNIGRSKGVVMIAGGIGITPFLSVLRHSIRILNNLNKTTLFWGCSDPGDFFSLGEIDVFNFFMDFTAVIVSERPFQPKHLKKHRITSLRFEEGLLDAGLFQRHADFRGMDVFVCGSNAMQEFVLGQLQQCGVEREKIEIEKFGA
ncbi:MAG: FAD-dependent oxidoreductase [Chitinispirillaceae bacterium]|nr:FAD-dependent oxidoreductase [Chitinispirillaceae bacterium]